MPRNNRRYQFIMQPGLFQFYPTIMWNDPIGARNWNGTYRFTQTSENNAMFSYDTETKSSGKRFNEIELERAFLYALYPFNLAIRYDKKAIRWTVERRVRIMPEPMNYTTISDRPAKIIYRWLDENGPSSFSNRPWWIYWILSWESVSRLYIMNCDKKKKSLD